MYMKMYPYCPKAIYKSVQNSSPLKNPPYLDANVLFKRFHRSRVKALGIRGNIGFLTVFIALICTRDSKSLTPLVFDNLKSVDSIENAILTGIN